MRVLLSFFLAALAAGCATHTPVTAPAPLATSCPKPVPADAHCYTGEDGAGAFYWIAIPDGWTPATGVLVMHAHGGPAGTGPAKAERSREDLERWAVTVQAGYAWAGSTYRRGGYGVTMAAEDTERLRRIFVRQFGRPRRTILHGQSYGGGVASKGAELYEGQDNPYDGVLLTSGVLGGGTRAYDFRLDLRVVYQSVCHNHPSASEPQYPLWMGLPQGSTLTHAELEARIDECTGIRKPAAQRTPQQRANLATILDVVRIPEKSLVGHMNWATWLFQDLTQLRLGGRNPFTNVGAEYRGSPDDKALNQDVLRYAADPAAVQMLAKDSAPDGKVTRPTLTLHAIDDPTAFVELESLYRDIRERAGTGGLLVQTFSAEAKHSFLSAPEYAALFTALLGWIDRGEKPTPQSVLRLCQGYEARFGSGCYIRPDYTPRPLETRVTPRG
jgi:hypothetical protein